MLTGGLIGLDWYSDGGAAPGGIHWDKTLKRLIDLS